VRLSLLVLLVCVACEAEPLTDRAVRTLEWSELPEVVGELTDVPASIRALAGQVVRMDGELLRVDESVVHLVSHFERVGCVGLVPGVERQVRIILPPGYVLPARGEAARITGRFGIEPVDGWLGAIYRLQVSEIEWID